MELQGKKALVSGSRRGIGRAIALEPARAGCDVGLNSIEKDSEAERGQTDADDRTVGAIPSRRVGLPDNIAQLVRFLCSPQSSYINGAFLVCDGGFLVGGTPR